MCSVPVRRYPGIGTVHSMWLSDEDEDVEPLGDDDIAPSDHLSDLMDDEEALADDEAMSEAWSEEELDDMYDPTDLEDYG